MPRPLRLVLPLLVCACVAMPHDSASVFDPIAMDPPIDREHPARMAEALGFPSGGARLNGILYEASGAGPHPTVVLLHGFPGNERNLDLAHAIRRAGWNVVFFHYRGAWGSGGGFSFTHVLEDVAAVVGAIREPAFAVAHRVDASRIALVGHSMGGFAALVSARELRAVRCAVSIAGPNLGALGRSLADPVAGDTTARTLEGWGSGPLRGFSGRSLVAELRAQADRFDTTRDVAALAEMPVLLVAGRRDEITPPAQHHDPLVATLQAHGASRLHVVVLDADHAFSDRRIALAREVVDFLEAMCRPD